MKQINSRVTYKRMARRHLLASCPDLGGDLKLLNVQRSLKLDAEILLKDEEQERLIYHFTVFTALFASCSCFDPAPATFLLATGRSEGWHAVPVTLMANLRHVARTTGTRKNEIRPIYIRFPAPLAF
jgi:hypothetical protein